MKEIKLKNRRIGHGQPCFIVAEVGINHNGDMELARKMIDAAATTGVDAVKFQNYRTEDFLSDTKLKYTYASQGKKVTESQFEMFKRCELSASSLLQLKKHCDKRNVVFLSTPTGDSGIQDLVRIKSPMLKNGSDYLGNIPLIKMMAETGIPTVISTGMATLSEIDEAVRAFEDAGGKELIILHCISQYPTPANDVNLNKIKSLQLAFNYPIGFSDHTYGTTASIGAYILGACFIEKHFTIDKNLPGPDHSFSSDTQEFKQLVSAIREAEKMMGTTVIKPTQKELKSRTGYKLSCVAIKNLSNNHKITAADIAFRRPGTGIPPNLTQWLIGQTLKRNIQKGDIFTINDI